MTFVRSARYKKLQVDRPRPLAIGSMREETRLKNTMGRVYVMNIGADPAWKGAFTRHHLRRAMMKRERFIDLDTNGKWGHKRVESHLVEAKICIRFGEDIQKTTTGLPGAKFLDRRTWREA